MNPRWSLPWLAAAIALLVVATLAGLARIGWSIPALPGRLLLEHGPLMVTGFLGTLITLERVVALGKRYLLAGAVFFALGGLFTLSGAALDLQTESATLLVGAAPDLQTESTTLLVGAAPDLQTESTTLLVGAAPLAGKILSLLGGLSLVYIFALILRQHRATYTWVMAAGALFLLVGTAFWTAGWSVARVVPWWTAFLVLTIAGERLELGRLLNYAPAARRFFLGAALLFGLGVAATAFWRDAGTRLLGAGMIALAVWHLRYDLARKTIRKPGVTRFIAVCMLSGYVWLLLGGILAVGFGAEPAGPRYDAQLHAVFLGFVFSMIFGHAPIIFPAIFGRPIRYHARFYLHLGLLHVSLVVRLWGDLAARPEIRRWGGMWNGIALLVFLVNTVAAVLLPLGLSDERPKLR